MRKEHKSASRCTGTKIGNSGRREREREEERKTISLHSGNILTET